MQCSPNDYYPQMNDQFSPHIFSPTNQQFHSQHQQHHIQQQRHHHHLQRRHHHQQQQMKVASSKMTFEEMMLQMSFNKPKEPLNQFINSQNMKDSSLMYTNNFSQQQQFWNNFYENNSAIFDMQQNSVAKTNSSHNILRLFLFYFLSLFLHSQVENIPFVMVNIVLLNFWFFMLQKCKKFKLRAVLITIWQWYDRVKKNKLCLAVFSRYSKSISNFFSF